MKLTLTEIESPAGPFCIAEDEKGVCALEFATHREHFEKMLRKRFGECRLEPARQPTDAALRLRRYLEGCLDALDGIDVDLGGTPFQRKVWAALRKIPAGETRSYAEIARAIGRPSAVRAVARANATNPVAIIVPCHRVIRSDGGIGGYGGGIDRKRWLLQHEGYLLA